MKFPNLKTIQIILISTILLLSLVVGTQFVINDDTTEKLKLCKAQCDELERKNKKLEEELQDCQEEKEKYRKILIVMASNNIWSY